MTTTKKFRLLPFALAAAFLSSPLARALEETPMPNEATKDLDDKTLLKHAPDFSQTKAKHLPGRVRAPKRKTPKPKSESKAEPGSASH